MKILDIQNVSKKFGNSTVVDDISFSVNSGEIYGLLGPNGAGKSTTINMICGLLSQTKGDILVFDKNTKKNLKSTKRDIGIVPQDIAIYEDLTAIENVMFFGSIYGISKKELKAKANKALEFVGLLDKAKTLPSKFSGGMKRRLNIACALVYEPKLIIMDEPTVGIDPQSRNYILESIKTLNKQGATIIYTSHYMEEVEEICTKIAIMDKGTIIAQGSKDELKHMCSELSQLELSISTPNNRDDILELIKNIENVENVLLNDNKLLITIKKSDKLEQILSVLIKNNISIQSINQKNIDLETVFLNLTGKKLRD